MTKEDIEFYESIWRSREHKCEVCGKKLYGEIRSIYFDHLLEKSTHPHLRHTEWNIGLVCFDCHTVKTNGFPKEKHKQLIETAKQKESVRLAQEGNL